MDIGWLQKYVYEDDTFDDYQNDDDDGDGYDDAGG